MEEEQNMFQTEVDNEWATENTDDNLERPKILHNFRNKCSQVTHGLTPTGMCFYTFLIYTNSDEAG